MDINTVLMAPMKQTVKIGNVSQITGNVQTIQGALVVILYAIGGSIVGRFFENIKILRAQTSKL